MVFSWVRCLCSVRRVIVLRWFWLIVVGCFLRVSVSVILSWMMVIRWKVWLMVVWIIGW